MEAQHQTSHAGRKPLLKPFFFLDRGRAKTTLLESKNKEGIIHEGDIKVRFALLSPFLSMTCTVWWKG